MCLKTISTRLFVYLKNLQLFLAVSPVMEANPSFGSTNQTWLLPEHNVFAFAPDNKQALKAAIIWKNLPKMLTFPESNETGS